MGYKRKVSYSHYLHIQSYSIFNRINASGFYVPRVLFVRVLMFLQQHELILAQKTSIGMNIVGVASDLNGLQRGSFNELTCQSTRKTHPRDSLPPLEQW
jgi:hypothetical protein